MADRSDSPRWDAAIRALPGALTAHARVPASTNVRDALAALDGLDALAGGGLGVLLVEHGAALYVLSADDLERILPSPATALARHEIAELLHRVAVRHALRAPALVISGSASLIAAADALRDAGWRPLVVVDAGVPSGVITARSLLSALARGAGGEAAAEVPVRLGRAGRSACAGVPA